jgi:uncharacterized protein
MWKIFHPWLDFHLHASRFSAVWQSKLALMRKQIEIRLPAAAAADPAAVRAALAAALGLAPQRLAGWQVLKRSLDARRRPVTARLEAEVWWDEAWESPPPPVADRERFPEVPAGARRVLIVGCGPAGMFAALECLRLGLRPVILERGKDASRRRFDLRPALVEGRIDEESNYCFGEGGAGTFSDGKLYTRATKRGNVRDVYETFVAHGAPPEILVEAHPHIGSNRLPNVVKAIRATVLDRGGEVHFQTKVVDFLLEDGPGGRRVRGLLSADGRVWEADKVLLATGHSARDVYALLARRGILLEDKPFAMGVRIEHPQALIDRLQYHLRRDEPRPPELPAARYQLACEIDGRGVHSFCMCPGGFIVPAATRNDEVVVNGMSLSRRDSPFANSGLVVTVQPEDLAPFRAGDGILAGLACQRALETAAKAAGGGGQRAPAQLAVDFLRRRGSRALPATSYRPGVAPAPLHELLPPGIARRLADGLGLFGRRMPGYLGPAALLVGFETRTSSPLRIPRDPATLQHPEVAGLFPVGEGAGFAGGIVSAALDGIRAARAAAG